MRYVVVALLALAALEAAPGQFQQAMLCLTIASASLVDAPAMKKD
jgi:hypothetical protein